MYKYVCAREKKKKSNNNTDLNLREEIDARALSFVVAV